MLKLKYVVYYIIHKKYNLIHFPWVEVRTTPSGWDRQLNIFLFSAIDSLATIDDWEFKKKSTNDLLLITTFPSATHKNVFRADRCRRPKISKLTLYNMRARSLYIRRPVSDWLLIHTKDGLDDV
jgi:hypothetical protein